MKYHIIKTLKYVLGATLAIFIAQLLGLAYAPSAGIITLLSLQETKKETLVTAGKRFLGFFAAMTIATVVFTLLGHTLPSFAAYLLVFVFICSVFSLPDSIAVCSVLVVHVWDTPNVTWDILINELLLITIGAGIGIALNLLLPKNIEKVIKKQEQIDDLFRKALNEISVAILQDPPPPLSSLSELNNALKQAESIAKTASKNALIEDISYYEKYIEMRKNQYAVLKRVELSLSRLYTQTEQGEMLSLYIKNIAKSFHECNNAERFLQQAKNINIFYKEQPLPVTRDEFESRAILFQILMDFEHFLILKKTLVDSLTENQMKKFWNERCEISVNS